VTPPTGRQWTIRHGEHVAVVVEVGGGLREYAVGSVPVLAGYAEHQECTAGRGQLLVPWPNRIRDGRYTFEGRAQQLPLTEPALHNASHGLLRWATWSLRDRADHRLVVGAVLHPQPGWSATLDVEVSYALADDGLTVAARATNVGDGRAPFGFGAHPYLALGDTAADDAVLTLPAASVVRTDERSLPTGVEPVPDELDFRRPRRLGTTELDTPYGNVARGADGRWVASLEAGGTTRVVWADEAFGWLQAFTGRARDGKGSPRGVAIEPTTCPPDAFNSGADLVVLEPGGRWSGTWGVRLA
jgi:aldose 1-epimerase